MIDQRTLAQRALAAQHLVAADILCRGFHCSVAAEGLRYDLIADIHGLRRIQVKMTSGLQNQFGRPRYRFWGGGLNKKLMDYIGDIDLFAFIVMDTWQIKYLFPEAMNVVAAAFHEAEFEQHRIDADWQTVITKWVPCAPGALPETVLNRTFA